MVPDANGYKYLGVTEMDILQEYEGECKESYMKRLKLLLKSKLNG